MGLMELVIIPFALLWSLMPLVTFVLAIQIHRRIGRIEAALQITRSPKAD